MISDVCASVMLPPLGGAAAAVTAFVQQIYGKCYFATCEEFSTGMVVIFRRLSCFCHPIFLETNTSASFVQVYTVTKW